MKHKYTVTFEACVHAKYAAVGVLRAEAQKRREFAKYMPANSRLAAQAAKTASELSAMADAIESALTEV